MPRKARGRRKAVQPGIQQHKILNYREDEEGIFWLIEGCIPKKYLPKLFNFAEKCFNFHTKINCNLCLAPYSLSEDGKLEHCSRQKRWIHYLVISLLALRMVHQFTVVIPRWSSGRLDTTTFICTATFLCYLVAFSVSSSYLILPDETIDAKHGWPKILAYCAEEDQEPMPLIGNTKTAVVMSSLAILAMAIAWNAAGITIVFNALPVSLLVTAEEAGLIPVTVKIPRIVWQLLFWPLELIMYILPMFMAAWGPMILMLNIMTAMNCVNQLRYASSSLES